VFPNKKRLWAHCPLGQNSHNHLTTTTLTTTIYAFIIYWKNADYKTMCKKNRGRTKKFYKKISDMTENLPPYRLLYY
ncbi:MAG: hypothetical protein KHZ13_13215, partial [Firmicutes bacterium]|nr:hypothetical protein [Bacillota bacterium]